MPCEQTATSPLSYIDKKDNILKVIPPWVKVPMNLYQRDVLCDPTCRHLFVDLLCLACLRKEDSTLINKGRIPFVYGQIAITNSKLENHTDIPRQKLRTALVQLKASRLINIVTTHRYTIITICNWDIYHGLSDNSNTVTDIAETQKEPPTKLSSKAKSLNDSNLGGSKNKELDTETRVGDDPHDSNASSCVSPVLESSPRNCICEEELLSKAIEVLKSVGGHFKQAVKSKDWIDNWRNPLQEVITKILTENNLEDEEVLIAIKGLLSGFFSDKVKCNQEAIRAKFFREDWTWYWSNAQRMLKIHQRDRNEKLVQNRMDELRESNQGLDPTQLRAKVTKQLEAVKYGESSRLHRKFEMSNTGVNSVLGVHA